MIFLYIYLASVLICLFGAYEHIKEVKEQGYYEDMVHIKHPLLRKHLIWEGLFDLLITICPLLNTVFSIGMIAVWTGVDIHFKRLWDRFQIWYNTPYEHSSK